MDNLTKIVTLRKLFWVLSIFVTYNCNIFSGRMEPRAENGKIDLRTWDIESNKFIKLDGLWEYYPNKIIEPDTFQIDSDLIPFVLLSVPKKWGDTSINGKPMDGIGYGTYRLKVFLNTNYKYAIKIKTLGTAYKIYWNGELVDSKGKVGSSSEIHIPDWNPVVAELGSLKEENELIVQISNFTVRNGGFWDSIIIGNLSEVIKLSHQNMIRDGFLSGECLL